MGGAQAKEKPVGKGWIIGETKPLASKYEVGKKIGLDGQFGYAMIVTDKKTGEKRVVKVINKARFNSAQYPEFKKEIELLRSLDHPSIVKGYDAFEDKSSLYIVMEYCGGGELFDRITSRKRYSEKDAQPILRQILSGVKYLHDKKIAHLDLKPDNLLFLTPADDSPIKIIDFGLSQFGKHRQYMTKFAGTSYYIAPEVLAGKYSFHADIWSMGVISFILLFGFPPFHGDNDATIHAGIRKGFQPVTKPGYGPWFPSSMQVSDSAKDLLTKMLTFDQAKRITADEVLAHPWMTGEKASEHPLSHVTDQLKNFLATSRFKANLLITMGALGDMLSDEEMVELNKSFKSLDKNGDGKISLGELKDALSKYGDKEGKEAQFLQKLIKSSDLDGDGALSYEELVAASVNRKLIAKEERLWNLFCKLDQNGDRKVSPREIAEHLGKSGKEAEDMIREIDKNGDGLVDYEEFLGMWMEKENESLKPLIKKPQDKKAAE